MRTRQQHTQHSRQLTWASMCVCGGGGIPVSVSAAVSFQEALRWDMHDTPARHTQGAEYQIRCLCRGSRRNGSAPHQRFTIHGTRLAPAPAPLSVARCTPHRRAHNSKSGCALPYPSLVSAVQQKSMSVNRNVQPSFTTCFPAVDCAFQDLHGFCVCDSLQPLLE